MTFDEWWNNHGKYNAAAKGGATPSVRELMKLAFEVGQEQLPKRKLLTDERIDQITRDRWGTKLLGVLVQAHREYARAVIQAYEGE